MNLMEAFAEQVRARPNAAAVIEPIDGLDKTATFLDLENRSRQIAGLLRQEGVKSGAAVLIFQPISTELYAALLAVFRLGAAAMFIDPSASRKQIEFCCEALPPRALLACPK